MVSQPHEPVRDKRRARRKGIVRKHLEEIGNPSDGFVPSPGVANGVPSFGVATNTARPSLKRRAQRSEASRTFDKIAKDETAARMCHDVERGRLLREAVEDHPRVLFGSPAHAEMVEREDPIAIRGRQRARKTSNSASARYAAAAFVERPMNEKERTFGRDGLAGRELRRRPMNLL